MEKEESTINDKTTIVGIGASAGGLEALQLLLTALPTNLGFPYVIIQHLSPDYKSLLSEILSKNTDMPVEQVKNGMELAPDCIYIIPPGKSMHISENRLVLVDQKPGEIHLPIDTFFRSLAEEAGPNAVAIVLSGTGSDGTNGIKAIKEHEGMIFVQSPDSCKFDGMPKSAIRTGLVDAQLTPDEIAFELDHLSKAARSGMYPPRTEKQLNDEQMKRVYHILKRVSSVNFTHYKQATILRRIERRMMLVHKDTLAEYVDYMHDTPEEARTLSREVLIGVTNFFREPEYFEILKERAIKPIVQNCRQGETIRAWVAGCSTGEEAYSIAILFCEVMDELNTKCQLKIFATDLDSDAVTTASKGIYGSNISTTVSAARLSRYFTHQGSSYIINREIRKLLVFAPHNVIQDPPFGRLDLVSCRNLMIYFQPVLQKDLFSIFHAALKDGGYLFLGKSEAVGAYTEVFPVVDAAAKIFNHRSDIKIKGAKPIPFLQTTSEEDSYNESEMPTDNTLAEGSTPEQITINTVLLERFMPACLVVNEKNELVYVYGDTKKFISFPVGRITNVLFDIISEQLRIPVSTVLKESREKQRLIQYKNIAFQSEFGNSVISLTATPIGRGGTTSIEPIENDNLFALIFSELSNDTLQADAKPYEIGNMAAQRITDLEQELGDVQEQLAKSVTEQECYNEELQASNEELLTANEELQSSNEELQSVNEELYTVNSEYQVKLTELADMNDDITNFLATTMVGIIFVDSKLSLRRFTNYVTTEFSVLEQDIGRTIDFISYHFREYDIVSACNKVLASLVPIEREVETTRGKVFFMRVSPFRTTENKILGCVITFVDVTKQKQEQAKLKNTEAQLSLARQASAAKSDFLSRMSHEIRTPMNALLGLSELLLRNLDNKEAVRESAHKIAGTVNYMTSLVSDILEMSRIEQSKIELVNKPFVIRDVLSDMLSMITLRMQEKSIDFKVKISDRLASVYIGDDTRIQQILTNLLTNAMKYTPTGGTVEFSARQESEKDGIATLCFVVSDTGIGISKEFMPHLFEPFTREQASDANALTSMGLGLPIAHNLAKLMDGDITVKSELGKGSTFTLIIRVGSAGGIKNASANGDMNVLSDYDVKGMNVLIAEDNELNRTILGSLLSHNKVSYSVAVDGEEAVKVFINSPEGTFDCILMDMRMPRMDGMRAAELIRDSGHPDAKTIPIVAVSANAFSDDIKNADKVGINHYITKPIDTNKLFLLLEEFKKEE